jgi:hypothetical protein
LTPIARSHRPDREGAGARASADDGKGADRPDLAVREGRSRARLAGWAELGCFGLKWLFLFTLNFYFLFFLFSLGNSIQTKPQFIFNYFKQVHQPKTKSRLSMMQTFIFSLGFNIPKKIIHLSHN